MKKKRNNIFTFVARVRKKSYRGNIQGEYLGPDTPTSLPVSYCSQWHLSAEQNRPPCIARATISA